MKQKGAAAHHLQRAFHGLRRAVEIWLFTHTPCPTRTVTDLLVRDSRDRESSQPTTRETVGAGRDSSRNPD